MNVHFAGMRRLLGVGVGGAGPARPAAATLLLRPRGAQQASNAQQLGDLDGVGGGALAEVVANDPEVQAAVVRGVTADAADEHVVAAGGVDGGGVDRVGGVVHDHHAGRLGEQLAALLGREGVARLHV